MLRENLNKLIKENKLEEAINLLKNEYIILFKEMLDYKNKKYDQDDSFNDLMAKIPNTYPEYSDTILVLGNSLISSDDKYKDVIEIMYNSYQKMKKHYKEESDYNKDMWNF